MLMKLAMLFMRALNYIYLLKVIISLLAVVRDPLVSCQFITVPSGCEGRPNSEYYLAFRKWIPCRSKIA